MSARPAARASAPASVTQRRREFEHECIKLFGEFAQVLGVPRSVGQIYGLLYASPRSLAFSDIVERLEVSKGSASQGLQLLRSFGAINIADLTGDKFQISNSGSRIAIRAPRGVAYEPELSLRKLVSGVLIERVTPLAAAGAERLTRLRELVEQNGDGNDFYLDRVRQLNTWRRRLNTVLPVLNMLLGPKIRK